MKNKEQYPYSFNKAQEEASKLKLKVDSKKAKNYTEAELKQALDDEKEKNEEQEQFIGEVEKMASESDDYKEFYQKAQENYIDSMAKGKNIGPNLVTQVSIWSEAFKLAAKDKPALFTFINKLKKIVSHSIKIDNVIDKEGKIDEQKNRELNQLKKEEEDKLLEAYHEYKKVTGDYKAYSELRKIDETLSPLGYGGPLAQRWTKLGISLENHINYGDVKLLTLADSKLHTIKNKIVNEMESVDGKDYGPIEKHDEILEKLFGKE